MKALGFVLIVVSTTLCGTAFSFKLLSRVRGLEDAISLTGVLASELRFTLAPMPEIIGTVANEIPGLPFLKACSDMCKSGVPFPQAWHLSLKKATEDGLLSEDLKALEHMGSVLGTTDINGALSELNYAEFILKQRHKEAKEKKQQLAGLYRTMGALAGIGLVIILM
ncbi:MAG: stage III sporulation protein AB [Hydrogenoanaerobacterium sp.]